MCVAGGGGVGNIIEACWRGPISYDVMIIKGGFIITYQWVVNITLWHQNKDIVVCLHPKASLTMKRGSGPCEEGWPGPVSDCDGIILNSPKACKSWMDNIYFHAIVLVGYDTHVCCKMTNKSKSSCSHFPHRFYGFVWISYSISKWGFSNSPRTQTWCGPPVDGEYQHWLQL